MTHLRKVVFLAVLLMAGCHHARGPQEWDSVRIYFSKPEMPYEVMNSVWARDRSEEGAMNTLRRIAYENGAQAVIVHKVNTTPTNDHRIPIRVFMAGDAIRFK